VGEKQALDPSPQSPIIFGAWRALKSQREDAAAAPGPVNRARATVGAYESESMDGCCEGIAAREGVDGESARTPRMTILYRLQYTVHARYPRSAVGWLTATRTATAAAEHAAGHSPVYCSA
jgi:hypothetical protein